MINELLLGDLTLMADAFAKNPKNSLRYQSIYKEGESIAIVEPFWNVTHVKYAAKTKDTEIKLRGYIKDMQSGDPMIRLIGDRHFKKTLKFSELLVLGHGHFEDDSLNIEFEYDQYDKPYTGRRFNTVNLRINEDNVEARLEDQDSSLVSIQARPSDFEGDLKLVNLRYFNAEKDVAYACNVKHNLNP